MSSIRDLSNPWRDALQPASFRGAIFHVDVGARSGGRRPALHEYPKRNDPYAEDMGRRALRFSVAGYIIGPNYLVARDQLIDALEADGPGLLRMPLPYQGRDISVMAGQYTMTETRERGGMCTFEMDFTEAGSPGFATASASTASTINKAAADLEKQTVGDE